MKKIKSIHSTTTWYIPTTNWEKIFRLGDKIPRWVVKELIKG